MTNIPKLIPVGEELQKVENQKTEEAVFTPSLNLTIKANEKILEALEGLMDTAYKAGDINLSHTLHIKIDEITEILGEQRLSVQLLALLDMFDGDKSKAAHQIKNWLENEKLYQLLD